MTMIPSDPQQPPTRRSLLKVAGAAAWATPAILAVSASPAVATSGPAGTVVFNPGGTRAARTSGLHFRTVQFRGASVTAVGGDIAIGALKLTVSFTPSDGSDEFLYYDEHIPSFSGITDQYNPQIFSVLNAVVIPAGQSLAISSTAGLNEGDGIYGGAYFESETHDGVFVLTFTAGGESASFPYSTAGAPTIAPGPGRNDAPAVRSSRRLSI